VRGLEAVRTGVAVGTAGVEHDSTDSAVGYRTFAPQYRVGPAPVRREHGRGGIGWSIVDHQSEVLGTVGFQTGRDARGTESQRQLRAFGHGAIPSTDRPAVSGRPSIRLAHCTACPAAPLPRLSSALTTTIRSLSVSTVTWRWQEFEP